MSALVHVAGALSTLLVINSLPVAWPVALTFPVLLGGAARIDYASGPDPGTRVPPGRALRTTIVVTCRYVLPKGIWQTVTKRSAGAYTRLWNGQIHPAALHGPR